MEFLKKSLEQILKIVDELEIEYKHHERKFTLDGHLFGSIGEIYACEKYNLKLEKSSKKGFDATDINKNEIQIKVTQRNKIGMRHKPKKLLVLKLNKKKLTFEEIYYGDGEEPWNESNKINSSGQRFITLNKLINIKAQYITAVAVVQPIQNNKFQ